MDHNFQGLGYFLGGRVLLGNKQKVLGAANRPREIKLLEVFMERILFSFNDVIILFRVLYISAL